MNKVNLRPDKEGRMWTVEVEGLRSGNWQEVLQIGDGQGWLSFRVKRVR